MLQILKKRCNFTLWRFLDLGNTSLEQNLRLKTSDYFLSIPAIFDLLFGCSMANFWLLLRKQSDSPDVNHCIWAIKFWSTKGDSEELGLYSEMSVQWTLITKTTHLPTNPKLQKKLSADLHADFSKCGNASNTQNSYSLTL